MPVRKRAESKGESVAEAYVSATKRLRQLPEVFTGSDVRILFGWQSDKASTYLANWRRAGLVRSLGGRSDVHLNLVQNPRANPEAALRRCYPLATRVGVDVLREAGWTTQIPSAPEVAVPRDHLYAVEGFSLTPRPMSWFERVKPGLQNNPEGVRSLLPAWALADMLDRALDGRVSEPWLLAPDDLDLEAALGHPQIKRAFAAFGISPELVTPLWYAELYDELNSPSERAQRQSRQRSA